MFAFFHWDGNLPVAIDFLKSVVNGLEIADAVFRNSLLLIFPGPFALLMFRDLENSVPLLQKSQYYLTQRCQHAMVEGQVSFQVRLIS